ncbi:MAG: DUF5118 domain-containing protein, partial [Chloroflexi bacterium]|nr:DUF5118 domain-containing protein [Chloroflexota bacterium]
MAFRKALPLSVAASLLTAFSSAPTAIAAGVNQVRAPIASRLLPDGASAASASTAASAGGAVSAAFPGNEADDNKSPAAPAAPATDPKKPDAKKPPTGPKPYKEVITAEAKSEPGLFTVHRLDEKVYWEIPAAMLNRDMLWQTEIAQVAAGHGYSGVSAGSHVVQW